MCYAPAMSPETIAILAVGVALAGLMLRGQYSLDKRVDELRRDIAGLDARLRSVETAGRGHVVMPAAFIVTRTSASKPAAPGAPRTSHPLPRRAHAGRAH